MRRERARLAQSPTVNQVFKARQSRLAISRAAATRGAVSISTATSSVRRAPQPLAVLECGVQMSNNRGLQKMFSKSDYSVLFF